jgi:serine/threonine-protein kinase HipA
VMAKAAKATRRPRQRARPAKTATITERRGRVLFDDIPAGVLEERPDGVVVFRYLDEYLARPDAEPVSLTLPLQPAPVESTGLHPFFDGLVPEGWLLDIATRNWKLDPRDRLGLLLNLCSECIGAVRVLPW